MQLQVCMQVHAMPYPTPAAWEIRLLGKKMPVVCKGGLGGRTLDMPYAPVNGYPDGLFGLGG